MASHLSSSRSSSPALRIGRALALAALWPALFVAACTDSKPSAATSGPTVTAPPGPTATTTTDTVPQGDGGAVPDNTSDASAADPTAGCAAVKFGRSGVEEVADAPELTAPTGGAITPGRYDLTQIIAVAPPDAGGPTGYFARKSILFTENGAFGFLQAEGNTTDGVGETVLTGGTFTINGTNLVTKINCPENTGAVVTYPYSAASGRVALQRGSRWEVYQKK